MQETIIRKFNQIKELYLKMKEFYNEKITPFFKRVGAVLELCFFATLPTIVCALFAYIDQNGSLLKFLSKECYGNGEFLLYSISLLSSAYITMKVYENRNTSFLVIFIISVSVLYAGTIKTMQVNNRNLMIVSIITFVIAVFYTWRAMGLKELDTKPLSDKDERSSIEIQERIEYPE